MFTTSLRRLSLAVVFGLSSVHAATLAHFTFTNGSLSSSAAPVTGITISSLGSDSLFNTFTSSSGWDSAAQVSGAAGFFSSPANHQAAQNAAYFSITAASGHRFSLESFSFLARSTGDAPADIGFRIGATYFDFSSSFSNNSTITSISNSSLGLRGLTSATISIQGWNASGSTALQLDNIILTGSVIPEPSTSLLCMFGTLVLLRRRR